MVSLNKTFLLKAVADYTEGSMLLVVDSLDEFVDLFKDYHARKREYMLAAVPRYYDMEWRRTLPAGYNIEWTRLCDEQREAEARFVNENNHKPFDFEFSTGCTYIKSGRGKGEFYDSMRIGVPAECVAGVESPGHWVVVLEFHSDLPRGTHYLGDYCA